ncbi:hypothetical protein R1flu_005457 [Riccia fluitans]|uniref:GB1/RHD3-type G domain-containing protein n=1 Tax=Riccia fluitans TaxID=41844 RepID=A0ABD1YT85_9MARC
MVAVDAMRNCVLLVYGLMLGAQVAFWISVVSVQSADEIPSFLREDPQSEYIELDMKGIGEGIPRGSLSGSEKYGAGSRMALQEEVEFTTPVQLMAPADGHDRLELNAAAVERLAAIKHPLAIVAVVGPYHGGKSFLLNVLLNSSHGFNVGAAPEPETRGIWIRFVPREQLTGVDGSTIILLDTEGFYGEGATRSYDAKVFALATLSGSHLVYNTLRTLGDAQSVAALADLSKQAQVFNLQNWLHSGDAIYDHSTAPLDVDPNILLKTLDFPPLTWVVQGFDMGLQSSQSPMDYLQRYLAAHARLGDRTLDTLFTQGIKCHTLRTPTDLNLLREVVGEEGLAADEELYPYLHPGYLSDVAQLQHTIFGNLTAKGQFTGKELAGVLPLLVHYVNEDFPLNADRKLRDVLIDVVVDSAFSGGVQYFQLCMESLPDKEKVLASRRGKEVKVALAQLESAEGGARLSALASMAFTAQEIEELLTYAERRSIDYCKQRCVGVPLAKSSPACEGQLGVKIARMKPRYREENDLRVREVLVLLGQGLRTTAEKEVDRLSLPMRESDIKQRCDQETKNSLTRYETLVGPHRSGRLYDEARVQMQTDIQNKCDKVYRLNAEKISVILNRGKEGYRNAYEEAMAKEGCLNTPGIQENVGTHELKKPCSTKKLTEISKTALAVARIALDKAVKEGGLLWLGNGEEQYDFQQYQCLQWSKQRFADFQAHNDARVLGYCDHQAALLTMQYKEQVSKITPFPDNDEVLTSKADQLAKHFLNEYGALVKDYLPSPMVEDRRKELVRSVEDLKEHVLRKNTALMRAYCYDPLLEAYKELRMQDCERSFDSVLRTRTFWSRKCLWPGPRYTFGFRYAAYVAARKHLDKAQEESSSSSDPGGQAGVVLSATTRNKVIQSWIEQDLAGNANVVFVNFSIVLSFIVGTLVTVSWLIRGLVQTKRQPFIRNVRTNGAYFGSPNLEENKREGYFGGFRQRSGR